MEAENAELKKNAQFLAREGDLEICLIFLLNMWWSFVDYAVKKNIYNKTKEVLLHFGFF